MPIMVLVVPTVDGVLSLVLFMLATSITSYLLTITHVVSSDYQQDVYMQRAVYILTH